LALENLSARKRGEGGARAKTREGEVGLVVKRSGIPHLTPALSAPGGGEGVLSTTQKSGPPPHPKGPRVFLDYDQAEPDAAYNQGAYQPNIQQLRDRWASNSERTRKRIGAPLRLPYGPSAIEQLDIFCTDRDAAPVFVFIHGGAWRAGLAKSYSAPAEMFIRSGAHFVVPDFVWVQDAEDSLFPMSEQVCRAIAWTYRNAASFGGHPNRIYVGGHSSGAHL